MTEARGRTFRRAGLLFEAASMLVMLGTQRGQVTFWQTYGLNPNIVLPLCFGIGILLWIVGTLAIYKDRTQGN